MGNDIQEKRKANLQGLANIFHRRRLGDYDESYEDFAKTYGLAWNEDELDDEAMEQAKERATCSHCLARTYRSEECVCEDDKGDAEDYDEVFAQLLNERQEKVEEIPRFASCREDETYGMIDVFETLTEAVSAQADAPTNGNTLNVPAGVYDLDTGEKVEIVLVALTVPAKQVLSMFVESYLTGEGPHADLLRKEFA